MRGVNVGRNRRFGPAALAREMAAWDVVNVGAAGTFVIRKPLGRKRLRDELRRRLPFEAELMVCSGADVLGLAEDEPPLGGADKDVKRFVSVLSARPRNMPCLPRSVPPGSDWQVRIIAARGRFVVSLWRRRGKRLIYPNEVVEKHFGIPATTRNWNTMGTICEVLKRKEM